MERNRDISYYDLLARPGHDLIGARITTALPYQVEQLQNFYRETVGSSVPEPINKLYSFENFQWTWLKPKSAEPRDIVLMGSDKPWTTRIDDALSVIIIQRYPRQGKGKLESLNVIFSGIVTDSSETKRILKLEYQLTNGNIHGLGANLFPEELTDEYRNHPFHLLEAPEEGFANSGVLTEAMVKKVLALKGLTRSSLPAIRAYDSRSLGGEVVFNDYPITPSDLGLQINSTGNEVGLSQEGLSNWKILVPRNIKS